MDFRSFLLLFEKDDHPWGDLVSDMRRVEKLHPDKIVLTPEQLQSQVLNPVAQPTLEAVLKAWELYSVPPEPWDTALKRALELDE